MALLEAAVLFGAKAAIESTPSFAAAAKDGSKRCAEKAIKEKEEGNNIAGNVLAMRSAYLSLVGGVLSVPGGLAKSVVDTGQIVVTSLVGREKDKQNIGKMNPWGSPAEREVRPYPRWRSASRKFAIATIAASAVGFPGLTIPAFYLASYMAAGTTSDVVSMYLNKRRSSRSDEKKENQFSKNLGKYVGEGGVNGEFGFRTNKVEGAEEVDGDSSTGVGGQQKIISLEKKVKELEDRLKKHEPILNQLEAAQQRAA